MKKLNGVDARAPTGTLISHTIALSPPARSIALSGGRPLRPARYLGHFSITLRRRATDADVVLAFLLRSLPLSLFHNFG